MRFISAAEIERIWNYGEFIPLLKEAFCSDYTVPQRSHFNFSSGVGTETSTLLIMPAWLEGEFVGVKTVTVSPHNHVFDLPSIQGIYSLISAKNGKVIAQLDAKKLTVKRTAAASALASQMLSRKDVKSHLMVGTGALSSELIKAHCQVRPIEEARVWGRSKEKALAITEQLKGLDVELKVEESIQAGVQSSDVVSVATLSSSPLIQGNWLQPGQHLDLVGAYRPDMREADDKVVKRSSIFVDSMAATQESGDLAIPLQEGTIEESNIKGDMFELSKGTIEGRSSDDEITLFKSVGHALEDLAAALYIVNKLNPKDLEP